MTPAESIAAAVLESHSAAYFALEPTQHVARAKVIASAAKAIEAVTGTLGLDDAVRIARGCLDYGGGHHTDGKMEAFHHGIQTVINSLEAAQKRGLGDTQVAALHRMGARATTNPS